MAEDVGTARLHVRPLKGTVESCLDIPKAGTVPLENERRLGDFLSLSQRMIQTDAADGNPSAPLVADARPEFDQDRLR